MSSKQFDVALVDPHSPAIEHYPRVRVTIDAATLDDVPAAVKQPPKGGESAEAEQKRLAFLVADVERKRAIDAYNAGMGLSGSQLRYDVAEAQEGSPEPVLPDAWIKHLAHIHRA